MAELARVHPMLYHMADESSWRSMQEHGLLSTSALLHLYGLHGAVREALESKRRPASVRLGAGVVLRDQKPLMEACLTRCLPDDFPPAAWYRILNRKVFFFPTLARLETMMRAYRERPHLVLAVDTARLLARYGEHVTLAAINTGYARRRAAQRGPETFLPPSQYPFEELRRRRGLTKAIVEVTVDCTVCLSSGLLRKASFYAFRDGGMQEGATLYDQGFP